MEVVGLWEMSREGWGGVSGWFELRVRVYAGASVAQTSNGSRHPCLQPIPGHRSTTSEPLDFAAA